MSSPAVPNRRPRDDEDDSDESESTTRFSPDPSNKRPRLSGVEDGERSDEYESDSSGSQYQSTQIATQRRRVHPGVGPGGYKAGAIVRIKMLNFVTYTSAEFFPGPKLNMVIGPNGTGKSTLVCAICLGLGWGPVHLGRAKDLGEFVKHGASEAMIEIELAGPPLFSQNRVIRRTIKRDGNKSSFFLDGESSNQKSVRKLAGDFAIQVDNLCQFLPQDKVAEFAALTPVELLHSTQRAAAKKEVVDWHEALKSLRAEQKKLQIDNGADQDVLKNLENRQEMQRADVERMRQRAEVKRKLELLEIYRPFVEYRDQLKTHETLKAKKLQLQEEHAQLKQDLEPAMQSVTAKQSYSERIKEVRDRRKHQVEQLHSAAVASGRKIDELQSEIKDLEGQIEAERKTGTKHRTEATAAQQTINRLQRQQEEEAVEFDPEYYNEKLRVKRLEKRELETKGKEIKDRRAPLLARCHELKALISEEERRLENLDSQSGRQEAKLQKLSADSYKAYQWMVDNQDKFENEVFGPPLITCSVTDPKYANAVESLLQKTDFTAFTVQNRNDFRTMQRVFIREMGLHDITLKTSSTPLSSMKAPVSNEELRRLGFDGWAKDFITGPEPVIASLCSENRLHQTPVSLQDISEEAYNSLENAEESAISSWVSGKHSYQVTRRREYKAKSTRVRQVKTAQAWTSQPVDASVKHQHREAIQTYNREFSELQEEANAEKEKTRDLLSALQRLEDEMEETDKEKQEKQHAHTQWRAIPERLAQQQAKLKGIQELFLEVRERVCQIREDQIEVSVKKAEATIEYADTVEQLRQAYEDLLKVEVQHLEASSDLQTLRNKHHAFAVMLEKKTAEVAEAIEAVKANRTKGRALGTQAKKVIEENQGDPDAEEVHNLLSAPEYNMDKLRADIDSEKARLELTQGGSPHLIKEFEEREKQIKKLQDKLADFQTKLADYQTSIDEVRSHWEPKLDALIAKISDAFSDSFKRIGCAGQVSLDKVEDEPGPNGEPGGSDFEKWSIQIHVKFRENENLSLLDSHRQSGGERAVSTIFYLMALQSLSASPFRVVDEINQGMDPRNERMVHGRLVDIACASSEEEDTDDNGNPIGGGGGGQYFLITPKLLSGLVYKPGMKVLCIYSGEHMPEDYTKLDFRLAIRMMKDIRAKNEDDGKGKGKGKGKGRATGSSNSVEVYA
ncbi:hypothetical protein N7476_004484 [Penicillium atrosanguineum]|uniref:Structural maintenance of chromosomes protein 5 n=1 Tax=Penicillium atrosanguineum TaxID=1132637 RepID=A0A9W9Q082_9EURO|nr:hypothetical protein N7526_002655 [Penicillium atrosanguineum]KAJ5321482.1 hypothetical protein N7476_004484 [Penicillium atrosanguineum]